MNHIAISCTPDKSSEAQLLAESHQLEFIPDIRLSHSRFEHLLVLTPDHLCLQPTTQQQSHFAPFYIDFLSKKMRYRCDQSKHQKELIVKVMGIKPQDNPVIIDATAGLGRDSFILANSGFNVIMLERSLIFYLLLQDALNRAKNNDTTAESAKKLKLIYADSIHWLQDIPANIRPDVIYLDPMYPARVKSAAVKKEMKLLQQLIHTDLDSESLFKVASTCANRRVVVKRSRLCAHISEQKPDFSLIGNSSRFDVYLKRQLVL